MLLKQSQKKISQFESQLYSFPPQQQVSTLREIEQELLKPDCNNHTGLVSTLAKFFAHTKSEFLRIKILEILKRTFPLLQHNISDWRSIITFFTMECYSTNYLVSLISLNAIYQLMPIISKSFDIFNLTIDLFYNCKEDRELYIASKTLIEMVSKHFLYQFLSRINKVPTIQYLKTKKLTILLKCTIFGRPYHHLFQQQIAQFIATVQAELEAPNFDKIRLHLLYNYLKLNLTTANVHQLLQRHDVQKQILQSSSKIKNLFVKVYKQYNKTLHCDAESQSLVEQMNGSDTIECTIPLVIEGFGNDFARIQELVQQSLGSYHKIVKLVEIFQTIFDFACQMILVTVSVQTENQLQQSIELIDQLIWLIYRKAKVDYFVDMEVKEKLLVLSVQVYQALGADNSQSSLMQILSQELHLRLKVLAIKLLYNINEKQLAQQVINSIDSVPLHTEQYLIYLMKLDIREENQYWADFQTDSTQYIIRQDVIRVYEEYHDLLTDLENLKDLTAELAANSVEKLYGLLQKLGALSNKIEFFTNQNYAEDATYLQHIVTEKLIQYLSRRADYEFDLDNFIHQDQSSIISKLIQFNKVRFIKDFLPTLRAEKLLEFIMKMKTAIYYYPRILLKLVKSPSVQDSLVVIDELHTKWNLRFHIRMSRAVSDTTVMLVYRCNQEQEKQIKMQMVEEYGTLVIQVDKGSSIAYCAKIFYKDQLVFETVQKECIY